MMILLLNPRKKEGGGISSYCEFVKEYLSINHKIIYRGSPDNKENLILFIHRVIRDLFVFIYNLKNYNIVHINTSLGRKGVIRDAPFLIIAKVFGKKVFLSIHGWDNKYAQYIQKHKYSIFRTIYSKANIITVLCSDFRNSLLQWGFNEKDIYIETNAVANPSVTSNYIIKQKPKIFNILFLARIRQEKGIYLAIQAYEKSKLKFNKISLAIAGNGESLQHVKEYVSKRNIENVNFLGFIDGNKKIKSFQKAHLYILPTYHNEGLPISILEAMSYGLPVITRPVGGIKDFFQNGKMGFITESKNPYDFAFFIEKIITNSKLRLQISNYNYNYAKEHFWAEKVISRLENIYNTITKK